MAIAYAAHTESCTFLLDEDGICQQIIRRATREKDHLARCIGAQYVASLDPDIPGRLVELPRAGAPLLFAYLTDTGRIALVRTGQVTKFETKRHDSGVRPADSSIEVDVVVEEEEDEESAARTRRFRVDDARRFFPIPSDARRHTPVPAVRHVTIVPPPATPTSPALRKTDGTQRKRRGMLPHRRAT
jgi:hypothetical protein